ncbi:MAG: vanadium-dependent haloperoxidase [Bacteroidota bacterium]
MRLSKVVLVITILYLGWSCASPKAEDVIVTQDDYFSAVDKVTQIMIHDIFSPPVASRIYVYPNIASYEIMALQNKSYNSLVGQVEGLTAIPAPRDINVNTQLSALIAHMEVSKTLIFSEDKLEQFRDSLYGVWASKNETQFEASQAYALEVASHMKVWIDKDNYSQTRTMPKFNVDASVASRWQPTPPAYMDGIEPHWNKIRTLSIDSASQFKPKSHPKFALDKGSDFHNELMEVYNVTNNITAEGDDSEEIEIAQFWDCNPYVSVTRGHFMFATKKITPGAHWIGITKIASQKANLSFDETIYAFTKTSIGIFDAFISCWDEKYRSNLIRPETLINQHIDEKWKPILQTPPFPEYTSGHSVVSGSASTVLTSIFGDNFQFDDDTEVAFGLPIRSFESFNKAAEEAAISRLYGGIHYMAAINDGLLQGRNVGKWVTNSLKMKN